MPIGSRRRKLKSEKGGNNNLSHENKVIFHKSMDLLISSILNDIIIINLIFKSLEVRREDKNICTNNDMNYLL